MSAFENAQRFFHACETPLGWEGCKVYVAEGARFVAQSEPLTEVHTVQAYCEWIKGFGTKRWAAVCCVGWPRRMQMGKRIPSLHPVTAFTLTAQPSRGKYKPR